MDERSGWDERPPPAPQPPPVDPYQGGDALTSLYPSQPREAVDPYQGGDARTTLYPSARSEPPDLIAYPPNVGGTDAVEAQPVVPARTRRHWFSPMRAVLAAALIVSSLVVAYGAFLERGGLQIAIIVSGLAVLGIALLAFSAIGGVAAVRAGQDGRAGRALGHAILGGLCAIAAAGSLAGAVVLALLASSA